MKFVKFVEPRGSGVPDYLKIATGESSSSAEIDGSWRAGSSSVPAVLIESRLLGEQVWLLLDDSAAGLLQRRLDLVGDHRMIFTLAEVEAVLGMIRADVRAIAEVKRCFPGAAVRSVSSIWEDA